MKASRTLLTGIALVGLFSGCTTAGTRPGSLPRDQVPAAYIDNQLAGTWRGSFSKFAASLYEDEGDVVMQIRPDGTFTATISRAKLGTNNLAKAENLSGTVTARGDRVTLVTVQGPRLTLMRRGDALYTVAEDPMVGAPIAMSLQHEARQLSGAGTSAVPPLQ
jgi:hypothetical protein